MTAPTPGILDELYGLGPEEFTGRRNEIARELKKAGDREAAAAVAALRKPGVHIWAVNRLARERALAVTRLLSAAANLAEAQQLALAGEPEAGARLRQDSGEYQRALDLAVREAAGLLRDAARGASEETSRRVREVLAGAALGDEEARGRLAAGTLAEVPEPAPGFGIAWSGDVAPRIEAQRKGVSTGERGRPGVAAPGGSRVPEPPPAADPGPDRRARHQLRIEARHAAETAAAAATRLAEVARRARRRAGLAAASAASAESEAAEAESRAAAAAATAADAAAHYQDLQTAE